MKSNLKLKVVPTTTHKRTWTRPPVGITIDHGIPLPVIYRKEAYPFKQMRVKDSFLVSHRTLATVRMTVTNWKHAQKVKRSAYKSFDFCVAAVTGGVRVWRLK
jgi:hypothetical protein